MNDQQRAAMQMALEALEFYQRRCNEQGFYSVNKQQLPMEAITALREALAQPQGEPVAFEQWYEANVEAMNIADFKPWMSEAWDAAIEATKEQLFKELMDMHRAANGQHNYYQYAVIQLRGEPV